MDLVGRVMMGFWSKKIVSLLLYNWQILGRFPQCDCSHPLSQWLDCSELAILVSLQETPLCYRNDVKISQHEFLLRYPLTPNL